jgi:hypothetical protein
VRVNPDVLIRDDKWILEQMMNPDKKAIFRPYTFNAIHSDFYAFRPVVYHDLNVTPETLQLWADQSSSAEKFLFRKFGSLFLPEQLCTATVLKQGCSEAQKNDLKHGAVGIARNESDSVVAILPNVTIPGMLARMIGRDSPVLHFHPLVNYCPNYFNATNGKQF